MKEKAPWGVAITVVLITLIVWVFFNLMKMPLDPPATGVVALIVTALVMVVRWVGSRHAKGEAKGDPK